MENNFLLQTDAYKITHWMQYPEGSQTVYSYLEARTDEPVVFFGLQYLLKKLAEVRVTKEMVQEAKEEWTKVLGDKSYFNEKGWMHIVDKHDGRLPLLVKAVDEGTVVPGRQILCSIENTDNKVPWLVGFVETMIMRVWYPCTVATISHKVKNTIQSYCETTSDIDEDDFSKMFWLNDFGYRGVSSEESAGIGGMAHLTSFAGTDTMAAVQYAKKYYDAEGAIGLSVMATEHSTTTSHGELNEEDAYRHFLKNCPPDAILSVVADSYNYYNAVDTIFGKNLRSEILSRPGRFVVRPDSGEPVNMAMYGLQSLWNNFGGEINSKGYKVLDPHVGMIYGDGIDLKMIGKICAKMKEEGFSVEPRNMIFGMGGGLLQKCDRDTFSFAFKCSAIKVAGEKFYRDVYKIAKGKSSKRGRMMLNQHLQTINTDWATDDDIDQLEIRFHDGFLENETNFQKVREKIKGSK